MGPREKEYWWLKGKVVFLPKKVKQEMNKELNRPGEITTLREMCNIMKQYLNKLTDLEKVLYNIK